MAVPALRETITSLIDLAEQGQIDPWDVRVLEVLDRYFQQLQEMVDSGQAGVGKTSYDVHLSQSAQAFVSAAMLVLLKANQLTLDEFPPAPELEEEVEPLEDDGQGRRRIPLKLEDCIKRRGTAQPVQERRVSLQEMITQLQEVAALIISQPKRQRTRQPTRRQKVNAIRQLAHQENLAEVAALLQDSLTLYQRRHPGTQWIPFETLVSEIPRESLVSGTHPDDDEKQARKRDRVGAFWGLLLLASQSKVELRQQTLYGDLYIQPLTESEEPALPLAAGE
ncbi:MAG: segregation/condensation protein A [Cyanobacteria bacterium P01_H01_bin.130]